MHKIDVPIFEDKELQTRFENWLRARGTSFALSKSKSAETFMVIARDAQDAYWIGCNYITLAYKIFDGPLTRTLSGKPI
jgi:hypothetical protein